MAQVAYCLLGQDALRRLEFDACFLQPVENQAEMGQVVLEGVRIADYVVDEAVAELARVSRENMRHQALVRRGRRFEPKSQAPELELAQETAESGLVTVLPGDADLPVSLLAVQAAKNLCLAQGVENFSTCQREWVVVGFRNLI